MTSFQSLLSSIGGGQPKAPQSKTTCASNSAALKTPDSTRPQMPPSNARPIANNLAAGVKRKPEDQSGPSHPKTVRTDVKVPVWPSSQNGIPSAAKPVSSTSSTSTTLAAPTAYKGTARPSGSTHLAKPAPRPITRPSSATKGNTAITTAIADAPSKPKRGFAAIMEKAKAAEEAAKAAGSSMIKHKTVEKMSKRERERERERAQQMAANGKPGGKVAKAGALADRSRSGTPNAVKPGMPKKGPETAYKGTMKGPAKSIPEIAYKGTLRKSLPGDQAAKQAAKKGMAQDKYGGYASWSDLSGAEDEEEEDYDSDGSSKMEAGLDDVEAEESMALRAAQREDREAMEEEERLRREKNERKKKLLALSKSAAARKKY